MTFDPTITVAAAWSAILVVVSAAIAWGALRNTVKENKERAQEAISSAQLAQDKVSDLKEELQSDRLDNARTFATKAGMEHLEKTVIGSVNEVGQRLEKRLDQMTDRLDRVIEHDSHTTPRKVRD